MLTLLLEGAGLFDPVRDALLAIFLIVAIVAGIVPEFFLTEIDHVGCHIVHQIDVMRYQYDCGVGAHGIGDELTELQYPSDIDVARWFVHNVQCNVQCNMQ